MKKFWGVALGSHRFGFFRRHKQITGDYFIDCRRVVTT
jgi:hypothetical protein